MDDCAFNQFVCMKIIVQFSGGKDSHAALIWAVKKYGAENITAQFSDTG
jgi:7-cyano-7-deazaguanine synthase in queuosine biosynthesis